MPANPIGYPLQAHRITSCNILPNLVTACCCLRVIKPIKTNKNQPPPDFPHALVLLRQGTEMPNLERPRANSSASNSPPEKQRLCEGFWQRAEREIWVATIVKKYCAFALGRMNISFFFMLLPHTMFRASLNWQMSRGNSLDLGGQKELTVIYGDQQSLIQQTWSSCHLSSFTPFVQFSTDFRSQSPELIKGSKMIMGREVRPIIENISKALQQLYSAHFASSAAVVFVNGPEEAAAVSDAIAEDHLGSFTDLAGFRTCPKVHTA